MSTASTPADAVPVAEPTVPPIAPPRFRALLIGALLVIALAFLIPYFNLTLGKFDWGFRPLGTGPVFLLLLLVWPINAGLKRLRPGLALTGAELMLIYAMMAITAAIAGEGLFAYVLVNAVHPGYFATHENRWHELFMSSTPTWIQVTRPEAIRWFYEGLPEGAAIPWADWIAPLLAWSLFALALYLGFFCLCCLMRKDWIEGQRLSFPFAAVPIDVAGEPGGFTAGAILRNPILWIGFALPVVQSLVQMAHAFYPAVPYTPFYWQLGRAFGNSGPLSALQGTYGYVGFETIGILALLPAEVSLSLWLFFVLNRVQLFSFAALGFGQEGMGARVFSPEAFITYQEAGACLMLALLLLWQSRKSIAVAFRRLAGRPAPYDPLDPLSPGGAAIGLIASAAFLLYWASRAGMDLVAFALLMTIFVGYSIASTRLVAAGGIYVPSVSMAPREVLLGLTGTSAYPVRTLSLLTYLEHTFMLQYKVNFMHFAMNDLKVLHTSRMRGRLGALALLLAVLLMMAIVPWVNLAACYHRGALLMDTWQFQDSGTGQFGQLAASLHSPEAAQTYLPIGLVCGAALMLLLTWLHTSFLWWQLSPIGFVMGGTNAMNTRIWTNALLAWLLVVLLRRFGGLKLYRTWRPAFVGMVLGHFAIMGLRSMIDPMLGLTMQLSPWA